jgi:hypothetical protein
MQVLAERGRGGGQVHDAAAGPHAAQQSAAADADLLHRGASRKGQEHDVAALADIGHRLAGIDAGLAQALQGRVVQVEGAHRDARFQRQVAAHRLAHHAHADKSEHRSSQTQLTLRDPQEAVVSPARPGHEAAW